MRPYEPGVPPLQNVLQGPMADRNSAGIKRVHGARNVQPGNGLARQVRAAILNDPILYLGSIDFLYNADSDAWTTRTWTQHTDEMNPTADSASTMPAVPIGRMRSGYDWLSTLFVSYGYGPVQEITSDAPSLEHVQTNTVKVELLDKDGVAMMSAQYTTFTDLNVVTSAQAFSQNQSEVTYEADAPAAEFWGVKVTMTFANTPIWDNDLNVFRAALTYAVFERPDLNFFPTLTTHIFAEPELTGTMDSDIAWFNASDHTKPFPWKINRARPKCVTNRLVDFFQEYADGDPPIVPYTLEMVFVDDEGTELASIDFFSTNTIACGFLWRLTAPDEDVTVNVGEPCILQWTFVDDNLQPIRKPLR